MLAVMPRSSGALVSLDYANWLDASWHASELGSFVSLDMYANWLDASWHSFVLKARKNGVYIVCALPS